MDVPAGYFDPVGHVESTLVLTSTNGTFSTKMVAVPEGQLVSIGRLTDPTDSDIVPKFVSAVVSRKHAAFTQQSGKFYVKDLGSASGTFVSDGKTDLQRLSEQTKESGLVELFDGSIIRLGNDYENGGTLHRCIQIKVGLPSMFAAAALEPDSAPAEAPAPAPVAAAPTPAASVPIPIPAAAEPVETTPAPVKASSLPPPPVAMSAASSAPKFVGSVPLPPPPLALSKSDAAVSSPLLTAASLPPAPIGAASPARASQVSPAVRVTTQVKAAPAAVSPASAPSRATSAPIAIVDKNKSASAAVAGDAPEATVGSFVDYTTEPSVKENVEKELNSVWTSVTSSPGAASKLRPSSGSPTAGSPVAQRAAKPGEKAAPEPHAECVAFVRSVPWETDLVGHRILHMAQSGEPMVLEFYEQLRYFPSAFKDVIIKEFKKTGHA